ncbi:putative uncharacterized protein [Parachlamydia acanthamoebae UV-7]|uniref:Uncharacterized protein n=1 Tax=Parachlamydia acanthamoebae (strain UV7) TaxID=765952 RepID=F8KYJ8_PARAV|nr:hypothetical protein pah_c050o180 [Parachlamydia acanthamoebae str. Hall's coccus]CCB85952.1 putative uncharacterized protein [Parachlamydia acanthamoebae UV-7]
MSYYLNEKCVTNTSCFFFQTDIPLKFFKKFKDTNESFSYICNTSSKHDRSIDYILIRPIFSYL